MIANFFCFIIQLYKATFSPYLPPACRFLPTCSDYSHDAFRYFGWKKGIWLTLSRISRCHPFAKAGYDPVPYLEKQHHKG